MRIMNSRGQTLPFYIIAVIMSLALSLFVMNYTNTIRWQIRAQNAADSAALAMISGDAGVANQISEEQLAKNAAENNVRDVINAMINAANGVGSSATQSNNAKGLTTSTCDPSDAGNGKGDDTGVACDDAYDQEPQVYDQAVAQYAQAVAMLDKLQSAPTTQLEPTTPQGGGTPAPLPSSPPGTSAPAVFSLIASQTSCWDRGDGAFDCGFYYTPNLTNAKPIWRDGSGGETVEVTACRHVTSVGGNFISRLLPSSFTAVARAAATLMPVTETFYPGTQIDSNTHKPYLAPESFPPEQGSCDGSNASGNTYCKGWLVAPAYIPDNTPLKVEVTFYVPALTQPSSTVPHSLACEQG
jgi:Flp pilus assembly protein TadG